MAEAPKTETAPAQEKPPVEKQTNCPACNKPLKRLKWYYRNGIFYCNKKCWRKKVKVKETKE